MKSLRVALMCCALMLPVTAAMGSIGVPIDVGVMTPDGMVYSIDVLPGDTFDVLVSLGGSDLLSLIAGQMNLQAIAQPDDPAGIFTLTAITFAGPWSNDPEEILVPGLPQTLDAGNGLTSDVIASMFGSDFPLASGNFAVISMSVSPLAATGMYALGASDGTFTDLDAYEIPGIPGLSLAVNVIPEPGVMGLMLVGTAILLQAGRRRRSR